MARLEQLGITPRELEILEAMAAGLSNREIGERLFVSENTVKTHTARLFDKLSARRRTQAVQRAKEEGLIPFVEPLPVGLVVALVSAAVFSRRRKRVEGDVGVVAGARV